MGGLQVVSAFLQCFISKAKGRVFFPYVLSNATMSYFSYLLRTQNDMFNLVLVLVRIETAFTEIRLKV